MSAEFDSEPIPGLPAKLPAGEKILWQGGSQWLAFAVDALHVKAVAVYFALLMAFRFSTAVADGASILTGLQGAAWALVLGLCVEAMLLAYAWASAWTTVYTITNRRVVIRYGVAYQIALNLPFSKIDSAAVKLAAAGTGDIPLQLSAGEHVAYLNLWPHVRRWHFTHPQPALRSVPDAAAVAKILGDALAKSMAEGQVRTPSMAGEMAGDTARKIAVRLPRAAMARATA